MKKFIRLRQQMIAYSLREKDLAELLGREPAYISSRMHEKLPWSASDMEIIGDALEIPRCEYAEYFVPVGISQRITPGRKSKKIA